VFLHFGVKNELKLKLITFRRTERLLENQGGHQMMFSKGEKAVISFQRFFSRHRAGHFHLKLNILIYGLSEKLKE